ncbi:hypothetical protein KY284_001467 [Solanum tuberosum]|nr:hypothetical protein KY284_001467 [Solanum tuberosum]
MITKVKLVDPLSKVSFLYHGKLFMSRTEPRRRYPGSASNTRLIQLSTPESVNIMELVVNPGQIDQTLLLSQHEHKSELLWKDDISFSSLMRTMRMNDAWNLFRLHQPHGRVEEILRRSGLYDIVCVGRMQYDRALVTVMVKRWRPETHCFHLPFGEVTNTLQDVQVLLGLCIDGDVVYMQDATWRIRPWRTLLETLTGCAIAPVDMDGKYSWGSAVLAYLYRALCRTSIGNVVDICRFIPLIQVWCWERILPVQPSAPPPHDGDVLLPYARRWTRGINRDTESHHVLILIRDQLDRMTKDQRRRLGPEVLEMLDKYFREWGNRHHSLRAEVDDGTSGAGYKLWYMRYGRLLIGKPALEVDVSSGFVHSAGTSIVMSRGLFKLHSPALQWQKDTASASHGEEGTSGTAHCDTEDTALYNTQDFIEGLLDDPIESQTTLSPLSSPDVTFIMPVDDMPQTPGRKKVAKRIVKNVNIKDLLAKKRKRDNEDEDGYTGLRPRDVLRISRKGCGT